jgi:hypothetical protein
MILNVPIQQIVYGLKIVIGVIISFKNAQYMLTLIKIKKNGN